MSTPSRLEDELKAEALRLGFDRVGIAPASPSAHTDAYRRWIEWGAHGEMGYLARDDARSRRADLSGTLEGVRSVVVVAHEYGQPDPPGVPDDPSRGVVARYARGTDYHGVIAPRLEELLEWLNGRAGQPVRGRAYADTGPVLERELGSRAGLGWFGKNTMLIHPRHGSYFFLGVLLLDLPLEPDPAFGEERCGTCRACLDACPTGALLGRGEDGAPLMDARRCISYLTIEVRGPIPRSLRRPIGNRVFGCDICQEVCPWNRRFGGEATDEAYRAADQLEGPNLVQFTDALLAMSEKQYQREFADSPLSRARRKGMLRNLCVGLGNWAEPETLPVLKKALADPQPLVRGHAAWAMGQVGTPEARKALTERRAVESDPFALSEIVATLED